MPAKPSPNTLMWTHGGRVQFDVDTFRRWADHYGYRFNVSTRVDHERADEPRKQVRVIFSLTDSDEQLELGGEQWELDLSETPETFIEIDETGCARTQLKDHSFILDLDRIEYEDGNLVIATGDAERHLPCSEF